MKLVYLLSPLAVGQTAAYLVTPDGTAAPGADPDCTEWVQDSYALTCEIIEAGFGITEAQFVAWNPSVNETGSDCALISDLYYCVQVNYISATGSLGTPTVPGQHVPTSTSVSVTTTIPPTTITTIIIASSTISTPTPYQTGMATDCDVFHLVVSGDTCSDVAADAGITLADFYAWNPAVGSTCATLDLGDYVCIGIIGSETATVTTSEATTTLSVTPTTTTTGNGITTPTPFQAGMVDDCDLFHLVVSGDSCYDVAAAAGIALDDFYAWNPEVGNSCADLYLGYYVCIGVE